MKDGMCPKCSADDVRMRANAQAYGSIAIGLFSATNLKVYVCVHCGFVESYVPEDKLDDIAQDKHWSRVNRIFEGH